MTVEATTHGSLAALVGRLRARRRRAPVRLEISFEECDGATLDAYQDDVTAAGGRVVWRELDAEAGTCLMAVDVEERREFGRRWEAFASSELGHVQRPPAAG